MCVSEKCVICYLNRLGLHVSIYEAWSSLLFKQLSGRTNFNRMPTTPTESNGKQLLLFAKCKRWLLMWTKSTLHCTYRIDFTFDFFTTALNSSEVYDELFVVSYMINWLLTYPFQQWTNALSIFIEGKRSVVCSKGPSPESTSTDVLWSKHGHGYDEEKPFNDHSSGDEISVCLTVLGIRFWIIVLVIGPIMRCLTN